MEEAERVVPQGVTITHLNSLGHSAFSIPFSKVMWFELLSLESLLSTSHLLHLAPAQGAQSEQQGHTPGSDAGWF